MIIRKTLANAIRCLAKDAVEKANSGHPGMPMGMADIAEVLWRDYLQHNPTNPRWFNRDRFILSNGHGSLLHYALLHLTGYDLSLEDLKAFRQLHSKTPGHPEYGDTPGVETTTGPLGQGLANGVGMALAEKILAARYNREALSLIDFYTYVFVGDGCLMEGVSHEAASLAGTWGLGKLIVFWDDNGISIDGKVEGWFTDDTPARFRSYGWQVIEAVDGHDSAAVSNAIAKARQETARPSLICCRTIIGYGSPNKAGTADVHGAPLGPDESRLTARELDWDYQPFEIPAAIYAAFDARARGQLAEENWQTLCQAYQQQHPDAYQEFQRRLQGMLPSAVEAVIAEYFKEIAATDTKVATRKASGDVIARLAPHLPELIGGSADLTGSNNTGWPDMHVYSDVCHDANYLQYGVREFAMSAIMNGLALTDAFIPFGGTFLVFQSYCANATRMSALMKQRVIYVFTHDSIGLGEDGPTHQPVMELQTLRMTPNMSVWRPADMLETLVAWHSALRYRGPTSLILSRQALPQLPRHEAQQAAIARGAYVIFETPGYPALLFIATGSEVALAIAAAKVLAEQGIDVRVVSMPSVNVFLAQDASYREHVLPALVRKRLAIEAASSAYWYQFVGLEGRVIGLDQFGVSAPAPAAYQAFGFTVSHIVEAAKQLLSGEKDAH